MADNITSTESTGLTGFLSLEYDCPVYGDHSDYLIDQVMEKNSRRKRGQLTFCSRCR